MHAQPSGFGTASWELPDLNESGSLYSVWKSLLM
jgi:hypothetical protein